MKDIYFFSCENIAIISSKALRHYPQIESYVFTHVKPVKSVLFFAMKEPFVTKSTFNASTPIGFANVVIESNQVRVTPLAIDNGVKRRLLEYIINFFTIPIVIEVSLNNQDLFNDVTFFDPGKHARSGHSHADTTAVHQGLRQYGQDMLKAGFHKKDKTFGMTVLGSVINNIRTFVRLLI